MARYRRSGRFHILVHLSQVHFQILQPSHLDLYHLLMQPFRWELELELVRALAGSLVPRVRVSLLARLRRSYGKERRVSP